MTRFVSWNRVKLVQARFKSVIHGGFGILRLCLRWSTVLTKSFECYRPMTAILNAALSRIWARPLVLSGLSIFPKLSCFSPPSRSTNADLILSTRQWHSSDSDFQRETRHHQISRWSVKFKMELSLKRWWISCTQWWILSCGKMEQFSRFSLSLPVPVPV